MSLLSRLAFLALCVWLVGFNVAHAAYSNLAPAPGWGGSAASGWTFDAKVAANSGNWVTSQNLTKTIANVGGRAVTVPASMRFAANAGQFAMNAIRLNPTMLAASVALAFVSAYGLSYDDIANKWTVQDERDVSGFMYYVTYSGKTGSGTTLDAAKADLVAQYNAQFPQVSGTGYWQERKTDVASVTSCGTPSSAFTCNLSITRTITYPQQQNGCANCSTTTFPTNTANAGRTVATVKEVYWRDAQDPDFEVPEGTPVPEALPEVVGPLPVELPVINPDPSPNGLPSPVRVPTGDPAPVPGTDPQVWEKPYLDIVPSPTLAEPWRVDVRPGSLMETNPNPIPDAEVIGPAPETPGDDDTATPPQDPAMPGVPTLYERKYPDGLAGVWSSRSAQLQQGPLWAFLGALVPSGIGDGGCPSFSLPSASVLGIDVGGPIEVPCGVWTFVRLVMIISALLLARRLVFGG